MSKELINAAAAGNVAEVTRLLEQPGIDINYKAVHPKVGYGRYSTTPLVAAMSEGKWEVARLLIMRGAKVDTVDHGVYEYGEWYTNAFVFAVPVFLHHSIKLDVATFKLLLTRARQINAIFAGAGPAQTMIHFIQIERQHVQYLIPYFFHEAILRNDMPTIEEILGYKFTPELSLKTMTDYIDGRQITPKEGHAIRQALDALIHKDYLLRSTADEIKKLIDKNIKFVLDLNIFPAELRVYLQHAPKSSISQLLAELFYLLYPEEGLIPYSLDAAILNKLDITTSCKTVEELRDWQDPSRIKWLAEMDQNHLLMRFHACTENTYENKNRCAEILAEILIHHRPEIALSEQYQQSFTSLINKLYSLTDMEKMLLGLTYKMNVELASVKSVCQSLEADNQELTTNLQAMTKRTKRIEDRLEELTALMMPEKARPGLFGK